MAAILSMNYQFPILVLFSFDHETRSNMKLTMLGKILLTFFFQGCLEKYPQGFTYLFLNRISNYEIIKILFVLVVNP